MGGGGFRGGMGGGGFRGGMGGGGFRGGGTWGGSRGGAWGGRGWNSWGGNRGWGWGRNVGWGRGWRGNGWGWGGWGWGWGGWGWPWYGGLGWSDYPYYDSGYYGGYPYNSFDYPAATYAGYSPAPSYSYSAPSYGYPVPQTYAAAPSNAPNVVVVYPPQNNPSPSPAGRVYDQYGQEIQQQPAVTQAAAPIYLIAFRSGDIRAAVAYWVSGTTLHYVQLDHTEKVAALNTVDRDLCIRLNLERHVNFSLNVVQ
jgi:hypothetical protein